MPRPVATPSGLAALTHHRWAIPVVAELHRDAGSKYVTLARRLGLSRDSLSRTLAALAELGLAARNPGHGHPLRPEYVLTPQGEPLGLPAAELADALRASGVEETALRKWSLPLLLALLGGPLRFSELRVRLDGITSRALALALKDLSAARLLERGADGPVFVLTETGLELSRLAAVLERAAQRAAGEQRHLTGTP